MHSTLSYFRARMPDPSAFKLSLFIILLVPFIWIQDEMGYKNQMDFAKEVYGKELVWHKIQDKKNTACVLSTIGVREDIAVLAAQKFGYVGSDAKLVKSGISIINFSDREGCEGVGQENMFMMPYLTSHGIHKADVGMYIIYMTIARGVYIWLLIMAIANLANMRYSWPENKVFREQRMNYLEFKKGAKKKGKKKGEKKKKFELKKPVKTSK